MRDFIYCVILPAIASLLAMLIHDLLHHDDD